MKKTHRIRTLKSKLGFPELECKHLLESHITSIGVGIGKFHFEMEQEREKSVSELRPIDRRMYKQCVALQRNSYASDEEYRLFLEYEEKIQRKAEELDTLLSGKEFLDSPMIKREFEILFLGIKAINDAYDRLSEMYKHHPHFSVCAGDFQARTDDRFQQLLRDWQRTEAILQQSDIEVFLSRDERVRIAIDSAFKADDYQYSVKRFNELAARYPDDPEILTYRGVVLFHCGKNRDAQSDLDAARKILEETGEERTLLYGICRDWLGVIARTAGDLEAAEEHHSKAIDIAGREHDYALQAHAHANLGAIVMWRGSFDPEEVLTYWSESQRLSGLAQNDYWTTHYGIDVCYMKFLAIASREDTDRAQVLGALLEDFRTYEKHAKSKDYIEHVARSIFHQANIAFALGDLDQSESLYERALSVARDMKVARLIWRIEHNLGNIAKERGAYEEAERCYDSAIVAMKKESLSLDMERIPRHCLDPLRSRILVLLDQGKGSEAVSLAAEYNRRLGTDFGLSEEELYSATAKMRTPNLIRGSYVLTE